MLPHAAVDKPQAAARSQALPLPSAQGLQTLCLVWFGQSAFPDLIRQAAPRESLPEGAYPVDVSMPGYGQAYRFPQGRNSATARAATALVSAGPKGRARQQKRSQIGLNS